MKIAWVCDKCNWLTISDSREHHKLDACSCAECWVDLEEEYCRMSGSPRTIAELKDGGKWKCVRGGKK